MTITQLHYVLAVAEHRNFTLAAEKCFVTQPTLSMQIQKIEDELGVLIFDRSKKPIQLTDIGEFRLGIIPTIMPTLLPMFLTNFIKKYPKVQLIIEELNTEDIIFKLNNGHLDAAIAATPLHEEKIKEIVLYFEPFVAYIPEHHNHFAKKEIQIEDLDVDELLLLQDGHCFRDSVLNLCKRNTDDKRSHFQLESGSFETLIKLADEVQSSQQIMSTDFEIKSSLTLWI